MSASADTPTGVSFVEIESPEEELAKIIQVVAERIPQRFDLDAMRDVQVLSPMNRGAVGACSLNVELQKGLKSSSPAPPPRTRRSAASTPPWASR